MSNNIANEFFLSDVIGVIEEVLNAGGEFRLSPKGISMLPLIKQGRDSVILKKNISDNEVTLNKYDIAFYRRSNGQFVIHRVMKIADDGTYVMCGDNQLYFEKNISNDQIIGYVSDIYRGKKRIDLNSWGYRTYVFFWSCMPLRHILMLPKRSINFIKRKIIGNK